jgi:hypothetical protein
MRRMTFIVRSVFVLLLTLLLLVSAPLTSRAQEATPMPAAAALATPIASDAAITSEVLATIRVPAAAVPPLPAIVDV